MCKVTLTEKGYTARTVSEDPAFAEFFQHNDDLETKILVVEKGVEVEAPGKTPKAIKVAQNQARIIRGFVEKGEGWRISPDGTRSRKGFSEPRG